MHSFPGFHLLLKVENGEDHFHFPRTEITPNCGPSELEVYKIEITQLFFCIFPICKIRNKSTVKRYHVLAVLFFVLSGSILKKQKSLFLH